MLFTLFKFCYKLPLTLLQNFQKAIGRKQESGRNNSSLFFFYKSALLPYIAGHCVGKEMSPKSDRISGWDCTGFSLIWPISRTSPATMNIKSSELAKSIFVTQYYYSHFHLSPSQFYVFSVPLTSLVVTPLLTFPNIA